MLRRKLYRLLEYSIPTNGLHALRNRLGGRIKFCVLLAMLLFSCILYTPTHAEGSIAPLPDTTENIHPGMTHDTDATDQQKRGVIDYVWGANRPQSPHTIHKSFYSKFDRSGGYPGNTAFPTYYSLNWYLANHPDWVVYLCDKKTPAYEFGDPNTPLDITNPAVLKFMLKTWIYPSLDYGYDGIAFDNVNLDNSQSDGRCGVWKYDDQGHKTWQYLYNDAQSIHGSAYTKTVVAWAQYMYGAIHNYRPTATMEMNYCPDNGGVPSQSVDFNEQLLPYTDLAFNEGGYTSKESGGRTADDNWRLEVQFSRDLAARNKGQLLTFGFNFSDLTRSQKQWALANYLLVKGPHTYIYIASINDNGDHYGSLNLISEYSARIGHPTSEIYEAQSIYVRNYSHGETLVNPSSSKAYTIKLDSTYRDLYGNDLPASIKLAPQSGIVLLYR